LTTTTSTYLGIAQNIARYQTMTADQPAVKNATAYYKANIGGVKSVADLVGNYRLLSYALHAYGLGDQINSTALIKQVLEGGVSNPKSLANTLPNPQWKAFAAAFDFTDAGAASPSSASSRATTSGDYVEQQLETNQGESDPGVQLALYFKRTAPAITSSYGILGDQNLLEVVQTIFGLSPTTNASQIDAEAASVAKLLPLSDLQNPQKLGQLIERFTANYDADYGPASGSASSLTIASGNESSAVSGASTILSGIVSSNGSFLAGLTGSSLISASLLSSLQCVTFGG
jgi:Protein of unknown function (DUF1217)